MIHKEYSWKANDGISLYGQSWMPDHHPKAIINYIHGFMDHSSRFEKWAIRFVDHGFGIVAVDLRGHGRSHGRRGYAQGFDSYLGDIAVLMKNSQELFGATAYHILFGHSLGGNLVVNYLISEKNLPDAAIITSPWFKLAEKPSWFHLAAARLIRFALPQMLVKSNIDARYLSRDNKIVEQYINDPLVHNRIRPKLFLEIEQRGTIASRSIYKINMPLLVMHGTDDQITSLRQTKSFVMNAGKQTTFREWPGAMHELHNDLPEKEVFIYLLNWIKNLIVKS